MTSAPPAQYRWTLFSSQANDDDAKESPPDRLVMVGAGQTVQYCDNSVKTSKYEWWNFLPKFLLEEFNPKTKFANCYFLVICGLQVVPQITNTNQYPTTLIPLLGVLIVAGVLKALEDIERHKADRAANSSLTEVLDRSSSQFVMKKWSEVQVGDYVRVRSRHVLPADVLVVQVWEPNPELPKGSCYVETKSLDGETNLKHRSVLPALLGKITSEKSLVQLQGKVVMEHPNPLIDHFTGVLEISASAVAALDIAVPNLAKSASSMPGSPTRIPISATNIILRGCVLRSTDFMVGLVLNTGHDVKIMQSKITSRVKSSKLEFLATQQLICVIALLLFLCLCLSVAQYNFNQYWQIRSFWYLEWKTSPGATFVIRFFATLLLHSSFVPVALYVSMALLRFGQAFFMQWDLAMYYEEKDLPMTVRTMNLNEELGQITHIFSDKTGTLTSNNMNFRKASIQGISYGKGITEIGKAAWRLQGKTIPVEMLEAEELASRSTTPHVSFYCPDFDRDYQSSLSEALKQSSTVQIATSSSDKDKPRIVSAQSNGNVSTTGIEMTSKKDPPKELHRPAQTAGTNSSSTNLQREKIRDFYRFLSVCHEVIPERLENGETKLSAPNPDDEALVCAAAYFGYDFKDRRDRFAVIYDQEINQNIEIEILYTIPFSSARKRMSVIIRDVDHKIKIITKGADTMILSRCDPNDVEMNRITSEHVNQFSQEGLRCLMVAMAVIEEENFQGWSKHYDEANTDLSELEKKKHGLENDIEVLEDLIERSLHVIGATGIEDRLQEGVPETIETLLQAGFKVWILTGDKEETAINIGIACNLLLPPAYMDHVIINTTVASDVKKAAYILRREIARYMKDSSESRAPTPPDVASRPAPAQNHDLNSDQTQGKLQEYDHLTYTLDDVAALPVGCRPRALIIDGPSLIPLMKDAKCRNLLLLFTQCCQSVVCCRVSPDQKREILDLVKENIPGVRALAIGDGANDVAMISSANIGVGIKGEEGVQAVNASDFAIGRFRFLSVLLLKHGRFNYIRMSTLMCFMLYKNIFMSMTMYWYNFYSGFSNSKFFTEAGIQFYNLFYTSLPVVLYAIGDQDIHPEMVFHFPQIYAFNVRDDYFNFRVVWHWILHAFLESAFVSVLTLYLLQNYDATYHGVFASHMEAGAVAFTTIVIAVNMKLFLFQRNWKTSQLIVLVLSIGAWFIIAFAANLILFADFNFYSIWTRVLRSGVFWLSLLLLVVAIGVKDLMWATLSRYVFYRPYHILQEIDQNEDSEYRTFREGTPPN